MKRRSFLQLSLALLGLPFLPKITAKPVFVGNNAPASGIPVGTIVPFSGRLPKGWLPCDGREVFQCEYPELWEICPSHLPDLNASRWLGVRDPGHQHGFEMFNQYIIKAK